MKLISKVSKNSFTTKKGVETNYVNYYLVCDNGKSIQIRCAFKEGYNSLPFLCDKEGLHLFKKQSKETYTSKSGTQCHYYNYSIGFDLTKTIQIRCAYADDYDRLDMVCEYVSNNK